MRNLDVFLIILGAIQPFLIRWGYVDFATFLPIQIGFLSMVFIYFLIKIGRLYFNTFSKETLLTLSINVDIKDILVGGLWGLTLYRYFELEFTIFLLWLLIGIIAIVIGFLPDFLISEKLGVKMKKGGNWISWNQLEWLAQNEFYFALKTKNNAIIEIPFLLPNISKNAQNTLKKILPEVRDANGIPLFENSDDILLLIPEVDFSIEEETLDDFVVKKQNYLVVTNDLIIQSNKSNRIRWSDVIDVEEEEETIHIRLNRPGGIKLEAHHYAPSEWKVFKEKITDYLK